MFFVWWRYNAVLETGKLLFWYFWAVARLLNYLHFKVEIAKLRKAIDAIESGRYTTREALQIIWTVRSRAFLSLYFSCTDTTFKKCYMALVAMMLFEAADVQEKEAMAYEKTIESL